VKRNRGPSASVRLRAAEGELKILRQLIGALVARAGGRVNLTADEINRYAGDQCVMEAKPTGVRLMIERKILVVQ
jgi:hypothetical protein